MSKSLLEALAEAVASRLRDGDIHYDDLPEALLETKFVDSELKPPQRCPNPHCRAQLRDQETDKSEQVFRTRCTGTSDGVHEETISFEKRRFFDLDWESVLEKVSTEISRELARFDQQSLPSSVHGVTKEGLRISIIGGRKPEREATKVYAHALRENQPTLLLVPDTEIDSYLETQSLFSTGSLVYTAPLSMLAEDSEYLENPVEAMEQIQALEEDIVREELGEESHKVVGRIHSNPRYMLTELNHMRLLRANKELEQSSGTRLEEVGYAAFSTLTPTYPDAGGEDDRGDELPDLIFKITDIAPDPDDKYATVGGIVDTKSGDDAKFGSEETEGKHTEYLSRARRNLDSEFISHIFVVNEIDGKKDIEFFDKMDEFYKANENLVIWYVDALAMLLDVALTVNIRNDLQLIGGDFQKLFYPFFVTEAFRETNVSGITRSVGHQPEQGVGKVQEEYNEEYKGRPRLHVITTDVVKERIRNFVKSPAEVEKDLAEYFRKPSVLSGGY
ncbi:hypothetical protein LPA44_12930 [Halobacterium sp. KA-4]|uniref:hypothetical protein n=1 Tax=Halobacterium sp. KA-4 TaxID=2896367 RepID=UPI001E4B0520|nr:hypothetical protein [Halobacterium sp. KA-4]MCD2200793.1 hypothetical protein [Halobacterium sp. KA-4]